MQRLKQLAQHWFRGLPRRMHLEQLEDRRLLTITVDTLIDELDGSIVDGDISLRDAIAAAPAGETIDFSVSGTIGLQLGQLSISKDLTIAGPGADRLTIDAQGLSRVLLLVSGVTEVSGVTIAGGAANGIRIEDGATATLSNLVIRENYYGGLFNEGQAHVYGSTITGNVGCGLCNQSKFYNSGILSVANSTISGNSAPLLAGGITNFFQGTLSVVNTSITGNSGGSAGGVFTGDYAQTTLSSSIVSGNSGGEFGASFYYYAEVLLNGFNLIGDSSQTTAEALQGVSIGLTDRLATSDGDVPTPIDAILNTQLANNGGTTPTHALVQGSPAIDRGGGGGGAMFDQRGAPFVRAYDGDVIPGARTDIGAFELQPRCDFDADADCDIEDIDALVGVIAAETHDAIYDLTGDGLVDLVDRDRWLAKAGASNLPSGNPYLLGDANLDGAVDGVDFAIWNDHKFSDTGKWSEGDWNADGVTNGIDFVIWNDRKFTSSDEAGRRLFDEPPSTAALAAKPVESIFAKLDEGETARPRLVADFFNVQPAANR